MSIMFPQIWDPLFADIISEQKAAWLMSILAHIIPKHAFY